MATIGPIMERILRSGATRILFDSALDPAPDPGWFEPDEWRRRGAVVAELGGRGRALAIESPAGPAVLRRYLRGGLVRHVNRDRYLFTGTDATRPFAEWRVTNRLHAMGLPVPRPLGAAFERRGAFYTAALLTQRIENARPLPDVAPSMRTRDWERVGDMLVRFAEAGLRHPDINANNIVIDNGGTCWLLDFDRARIDDARFDPGPMFGRLQRSLAKLGVEHDAAALRRIESS
ncbi:MAG: 3-deoxy-D-manno-octulosonic acid kinase [Candidatus Wenzhouxiangella sp. M2_3B_020]